MKFHCSILLCLLFSLPALHVSYGEEQIPLRGYVRSIHGGVIEYRSCQPDANAALLVRSLDSTEYIEWETSPVPSQFHGEEATFAWIFGIGANMEVRKFHLSVNGSPLVAFSRPEKIEQSEWTVRAANGAKLHFRRTLIDKNDDLFGYAFLTLPASLLERGKPLRIRVNGESAGSQVWYMTFQYGLADTVMIIPQEALLREGKNGLQPVSVDIIHLRDGAEVHLKSPEGAEVHSKLQFGFNRLVLKLRNTDAERTVAIGVGFDNTGMKSYSFLQKPIRKWTVYLVEHAHTDIGYTRPQTEILPEHLRFIDYALDYCDQTDSLPDDAKFRWTCEASWPVSQYLNNRPPEQIERFKRRVREGRIEATGMLFNMSELPDENAYVTFLKPILQFKKLGIPVQTGMQDDVNGVAWCLVDYCHDIGIKYLTMGENIARALRPFDVPTPFWWESPSGNRILVFRADHYMTGNFMGIERGKLDIVEPDMFEYLNNLERHAYPFDRIAVQYSGYFTDNSPPSTAGCNVIEAWNRKYLWPHLRSATDHEFPEYIEKTHANDLRTVRAAWPDWWTDGTGSAPRETAAARRTQAEMISTQGLLAMARILGVNIPAGMLDHNSSIMENLLFYDEHTFGAAESITDPRAENSEVQWAEKSAYVWDAVKNSGLAREYALGLLQDKLFHSTVPTITIFNTLSWKRSGLHTVYIDNQVLPSDREFTILDAHGKEVSAQLIAKRADGNYWGLWVEDVPPMGYKTLRIEVSGTPAAPEIQSNAAPSVLENAFYRVVLDPTRGTVKDIYDKELRKDLVDTSSPWQAGQFIRETLTNRQQLEQYRMDSYSRSTLKDVRIKSWSEGKIWKSVVFAGRSEACEGPDGVTCEVRLYNNAKRIEIRYSIMKLPITDPEALYVAFPFSLPGATIHYDVQGGTVVPGISQIPGSSSDWQTVQNFAAARNPSGQIIIGSDEAPLMQFGDINTGKFQRIARIDRPSVFSWVSNNYWTTNFLAEEDGELKWSYYLTSTPDTSDSYATEFGWGARVPFVSRVLPAGAGHGSAMDASFLKVLPSNILLVGATPSGDNTGIILQLREVDGKQTHLPLSGVLENARVRSADQVNVLGEKIRRLDDALDFKPLEVKFLELAQ